MRRKSRHLAAAWLLHSRIARDGMRQGLVAVFLAAVAVAPAVKASPETVFDRTATRTMAVGADGIAIAGAGPDSPQSATCDGTGVVVDSESEGSTNTGSSVTVSHTTSGTDRLMLVGVSWNKDGGTNLTSVTYGGTGLTQVLETDSGAEVYAEIWRLYNPPSARPTWWPR